MLEPLLQTAVGQDIEDRGVIPLIDRPWFSALLASAHSLLVLEPPRNGRVDGDILLLMAGVRCPMSEWERLMLDGLADLCHKLANPATAAFEAGSAVDGVVQYIRDHATNADVSRDEAAQSAGLSSSWLAHHLKDESGRSFTEHLRDTRMSLAQRMLATTGESVKGIAFAVGYGDAGAFVRQFRLQFGLPPAQWRARGILIAERKAQGARRKKGWLIRVPPNRVA